MALDRDIISLNLEGRLKTMDNEQVVQLLVIISWISVDGFNIVIFRCHYSAEDGYFQGDNM